MKALLLIAGLAIISTSCKSSFRITVKEPAAIKIPESVSNIGVIDNIDQTNTVESIGGLILNAEPFDGRKITADQVPTGAISGLNNSQNITGRVFDSDSLHLPDGGVNWTYIDSAGAANGHHAYMEIIKVEANNNVGGAIGATSQGKTSTKIYAHAIINLYVLENHQEVENYRVNRTRTIRVKSTETVIDVVSEAKRRKDNYRQLGVDLGQSIGRLVYPNWVWVNRMYFTKGSDILKRAKPMIANGNWDIAEKQLLIGLNDNSDKVLGRVTYNLALVKEGQGELDAAIKYAEISALQYGCKEATSYLSKLQTRKRIIENAAAREL